MPLYFAYGSNMASPRLLTRAASAHPLGAARLPGFAWRCNKRGADGTAKANLVQDAGAETWGALYRLGAADFDALDHAEGGYQRIVVEVWQEEIARNAYTYVSERFVDGELPAAWYLALVVAGAREHALPSDWIAALETAAQSAATRSTPSKGGT